MRSQVCILTSLLKYGAQWLRISLSKGIRTGFWNVVLSWKLDGWQSPFSVRNTEFSAHRFLECSATAYCDFHHFVTGVTALNSGRCSSLAVTAHQSGCHCTPVWLSPHTSLAVTAHQSGCHRTPVWLSPHTSLAVTAHQSGCHRTPVWLSLHTSLAISTHQATKKW